jgi:hypothetical protein
VARLARRVLAALALAALALPVAPARAAFPTGPPNDPSYPEETYLFSTMPPGRPLARDPEGAAGMSIDAAWRDFTIGRPDVVIAYIEGGINWHDPGIAEIADKIFVNPGELPPPERSNGDPWLNAPDYPSTPDANGNGFVDAEDLIVRFSNGVDDDGNGYVDDISGWDFYDDQNDPATYDAAYGHANGQMEQAAAITNNGIGGAGICPLCMLLPIKAGAEALDRTDDLAQAWLYAVDAGASVIVSTTADLGYSTFMREAVEYAAHRGVVMVEASNDFSSTDHQGGMFHPHVLPGNGLVADTAGLPEPAAALTTTYRVRSSYTSWGTHNLFSASTQGGTTSESTPTVGGVMALVLSWGREAADRGLMDGALTGFEAVQVVRATASDVDDPSLPWPGKPGWDLQYGYGRPNVHRAMQAIAAGDIPPVGTIESPDWFSLHDPTRVRRVAVTGTVEARRSTGYTWRLEMGLGPEPTERDFVLVGSGSGTAPYAGPLGEVDLTRIPEEFWRKPYALSVRKELETTEAYTFTLRLRVTDREGRVGEDRRTIFVRHDPSWVPGFPVRIGPGGESQPALADLDADGDLDIVFGDTDGFVHALDPATGHELPGWPATTDPTVVVRHHPGVNPRYEPVIAPVAVGDLDRSGRPSVVATSSTGSTYVFGPDGARRPGWPRRLDAGVVAPPIPRPALPYTRLPIRGAAAPPVLEDLDRDGCLEIIQAGWDGRIHVWRPDGTNLPGWPVEVVLRPEDRGPDPLGRHFTVNDHKLQAPPVVADLDGDGSFELVVRSQWTEVIGAGLQPLPYAHLHAYRADGSPVRGWPVTMPGIVEYYGSAQEFITEGSNAPVAADVDGDGDHEVASDAVFSPSYLFDGTGLLRAVYGPTPNPTLGLLAGQDPTQVLHRMLPTDLPVSFTTTGAFGRFGGTLTYAQPGSGGLSTAGLLAPGSGIPIRSFERAWGAATGLPKPFFPAVLQGLNFLGAPVLADVTGDGRAEILDGGDSSALHAYDVLGRQAAGFPKFHTGWAVWSPTVGDLDGDGRVEVVQTTREGYVFAWRTPGRADANVEWWHYRHDERNTGRYGADTRPPGVPLGLRLVGGLLTFRAPGDDWGAGRAARYLVTLGPAGVTLKLPARAAGGALERLDLPAGAAWASVRAVDDAGNLGAAATVRAADYSARLLKLV